MEQLKVQAKIVNAPKCKYLKEIPYLPSVAMVHMTQPLTNPSSRECKLAQVEGLTCKLFTFGDEDLPRPVSVLAK